MKKLIKKGKSGFTLVELVIVIAILAIVAAIAIPTAANVIGNANKAADAANAQSIEMAIKSCQSEYAAQGTNKSNTIATLFGDPLPGTGVPADSKKTLKSLLAAYGVDSSILKGLKQDASQGFMYDITTGKVTAGGSTGVKLTDALNYHVNVDSADADFGKIVIGS